MLNEITVRFCAHFVASLACCETVRLRDGQIRYLMWLSGSDQISTISQNLSPAKLHISCRIGWVLITGSTSVRQSVNAACHLCDSCRADSPCWSQTIKIIYNRDPCLALI